MEVMREELSRVAYEGSSSPRILAPGTSLPEPSDPGTDMEMDVSQEESKRMLYQTRHDSLRSLDHRLSDRFSVSISISFQLHPDVEFRLHLIRELACSHTFGSVSLLRCILAVHKALQIYCWTASRVIDIWLVGPVEAMVIEVLDLRFP